MATERVLHMKGGDGETSYTKNSLLQVSSLSGFRKQNAYKIDRGLSFCFPNLVKGKEFMTIYIYIYIYIYHIEYLGR